MREPRIFTEQPLQSGRQLLLESVPSRHLLKVLRLKADAPLRLFNGDGREFHARLIDTGKQGASVEVRELAAEEPERRKAAKPAAEVEEAPEVEETPVAEETVEEEPASEAEAADEENKDA